MLKEASDGTFCPTNRAPQTAEMESPPSRGGEALLGGSGFHYKQAEF